MSFVNRVFLMGLLVPAACKSVGDSTPVPLVDAAPNTALAPHGADAVPVPSGTPMQIRLNSTPPGAVAYIDGKKIGTTPMSHTVYVTGASVEFVFRLEGYQDATYSFVPQVAGEVHGRLVPVPSAPAAIPGSSP